MIYAPALLELRRRVDVHAACHVTGGGIPGNLIRVLPSECDAHVTARGAWDEPRIFSTIQTLGEIADDEMEHVFNLGLGMLVIVRPQDRHRALDRLRASGHPAWLVGEITAGEGRVFISHDRGVTCPQGWGQSVQIPRVSEPADESEQRAHGVQPRTPAV